MSDQDISTEEVNLELTPLEEALNKRDFNEVIVDPSEKFVTMADGSRGNKFDWKFNDERKRAFLKLFSSTGQYNKSALACGVSRQTILRHKKEDPVFAEAIVQAQLAFNERLEGEMFRRGVDGVEEPVYQGGAKVGYIKRYSDKLLTELAKRHIPEMTPQQRVATTATVTHTGDLKHEFNLGKLSKEERELARKLLEGRASDADNPSGS
ncbi:MAG: hypothetical protein K0U41_02315 [Gammaproteobacteria bacterium]|nr:hypothetical protein [Gammaproteobacteria bacterium]